jgi:hypothetical protein
MSGLHQKSSLTTFIKIARRPKPNLSLTWQVYFDSGRDLDGTRKCPTASAWKNPPHPRGGEAPQSFVLSHEWLSRKGLWMRLHKNLWSTWITKAKITSPTTTPQVTWWGIRGKGDSVFRRWGDFGLSFIKIFDALDLPGSMIIYQCPLSSIKIFDALDLPGP